MKLFLALLAASPAFAAERSLSVTDFDKIRVDGGFVVDVVRGRPTSVVVTGTPAAIDAVLASVQGTTLAIRRVRSASGNTAARPAEPARLRITTPALLNVWISGPATVGVDRMQGLRVGASLEGAGSLTIGALAADRFDLAMLGSGRVKLGGTVASFGAVVRGAGDIDAAALTAADAKIASETAGTITLGVKRSATITATGAGTITILGKPACTVRNTGSGDVVCGAR